MIGKSTVREFDLIFVSQMGEGQLTLSHDHAIVVSIHQ